MPKRRRNPQEFTIDEARTAQNIIDEGSFFCHGRMDKRPYYYPEIKISMCVREALEPASRVFRTSTRADRVKTVVCPPELFPPNGRGRWTISIMGTPAERIMERLKPLIPQYHQRQWETVKNECRRKTGVLKRPIRRLKRRPPR